ncbi:MAG: hypothetical protein ACP5IL_07810 [Syntrophobacteraceae bacterium]
MSEETAVTQPGRSENGASEMSATPVELDLVAGQTEGVTSSQTEADKRGSKEERSVLEASNDRKAVPKEPEKTGEEAKPESRAPQEYGDFTLPEGMKLEGQELDEFKSFAKEQDLTQDQAQKVLEFAGPKIKAMIEAPYTAWKELTEQWWTATKSDAEIGGTKLEQSMKDASQAFVAGESNPFFKTEAEVSALREALKVTGAMHNPEVQRLFVRMGKMLAEPAHLTGKPAPKDKQQAFYNSMYPTMAQEAQG